MRAFGKWIGRILFAAVLLIAAFLALAPPIVERLQNPIARHDPWPVSPEAIELHSALLIGDWHADSDLWQ